MVAVLRGFGQRAGDQVDLELAGEGAELTDDVAVEALRRRPQRVGTADREPLLGQHDQLCVVRGCTAHGGQRLLEVGRGIGAGRELDRRDAHRPARTVRAMSDFVADFQAAYATELPAIDLGRAVHEGALHQDVPVKLPLKMVNRHGLIAGATGTGKTKTLQGIIEQLSAAGVPTVVADVKGDVSGLHDPGAPDGPAPTRMGELGLPYAPTGFPTDSSRSAASGPACRFARPSRTSGRG